jgi:aminoglycoside phosphotransferase (APT) family kinase protein
MQPKDVLTNHAEVSLFLASYYNQAPTDVKELYGGKHSTAYSYALNTHEYVIRINENKDGFLKDEFAYRNFSGQGILIPRVHTTGYYNNELFFCISDKVTGETVRDQYKKEDFTSLQLQFDTIEKIRGSKGALPLRGFGEWSVTDGVGRYSTLSDYIQSTYHSKDIFDWDELFKIPYVDKKFTDYLDQKIQECIVYADTRPALMHGDFGNDNLFLIGNTATGIIDWEKSRYGDHFLDAGRVVLYCPNRKATTQAALAYYEKNNYKNYKHRIMLGVYYTMLTNYGFAAMAGNQASCDSSLQRIQEIEGVIGLETV